MFQQKRKENEKKDKTAFAGGKGGRGGGGVGVWLLGRGLEGAGVDVVLSEPRTDVSLLSTNYNQGLAEAAPHLPLHLQGRVFQTPILFLHKFNLLMQ